MLAVRRLPSILLITRTLSGGVRSVQLLSYASLTIKATVALGDHLSRGDRVNKLELIEALAGRTNLSKADAGRVVDALFNADGVIAGEMRGGARVQITGFGTFQVRDRAARTGRDPRTGQPIAIKAAKVPSFKAGQGLKDALNS